MVASTCITLVSIDSILEMFIVHIRFCINKILLKKKNQVYELVSAKMAWECE